MRKDSRKQSYKRERRSVGQAVRFALRIVFLIFLLIIVIGIFYFYHTYGKDLLQLQSQARQLVSESTAETFRAAQTSLVYDSEGDLISALKTEKDVYYINFEDIPEEAIDAMLVSEDRKFLEHGGIDYLANFRAAMALVKNKGKITQGASTITQQLARNVFLTHEVTYERKTEEIFIARELEKKYSKFDILEFYFNNIYFANGHYGIQAASFGYFGESITGLSLSEVVFLCAIPNNPNRYNPVTHFENTIARRDRILKQMLEDQMIGQQEYEQAVREKIQLKQSKLDKKNYVETYVYHSAIKALMAKQGFEFQYSFANEESKQRY
ncbi:MAG TPA: glycosyl transferase, partial [Lachnospiraceae bacterium]|nr:glycosyl transferase [Lachnospiraceae bacterium]